MRYIFIACLILFIAFEVATFTINHNYCDAANIFGLASCFLLAIDTDNEDK